MNKFNTYVIFFQMNNNEEHETCRSVHIKIDMNRTGCQNSYTGRLADNPM